MTLGETIHPPNSQPATNLMGCSLEASGNFHYMTTNSTFEPPRNSTSSVHHDVIINDLEDELITLEENQGRIPTDIEFILRQTSPTENISVTRPEVHNREKF